LKRGNLKMSVIEVKKIHEYSKEINTVEILGGHMK